jgi:hypothetical protein
VKGGGVENFHGFLLLSSMQRFVNQPVLRDGSHRICLVF